MNCRGNSAEHTWSKALGEPTGAAQRNNAWRCTMNINEALNPATGRLHLGEFESKSSSCSTWQELQFLRDRILKVHSEEIPGRYSETQACFFNPPHRIRTQILPQRSVTRQSGREDKRGQADLRAQPPQKTAINKRKGWMREGNYSIFYQD